MHPLIKYLHTSVLKRYLRYLFLKYLVRCNTILFLVTNSMVAHHYHVCFQWFSVINLILVST